MSLSTGTSQYGWNQFQCDYKMSLQTISPHTMPACNEKQFLNYSVTICTSFLSSACSWSMVEAAPLVCPLSALLQCADKARARAFCCCLLLTARPFPGWPPTCCSNLVNCLSTPRFPWQSVRNLAKLCGVLHPANGAEICVMA